MERKVPDRSHIKLPPRHAAEYYPELPDSDWRRIWTQQSMDTKASIFPLDNFNPGPGDYNPRKVSSELHVPTTRIDTSRSLVDIHFERWSSGADGAWDNRASYPNDKKKGINEVTILY